MALQSSAVWACVQLLASSVSMMPLLPYTMRNGVRTPIDPPTLIQTPAAGTSMADWIYMVMTSLLLRGNAYGRIVRRDAMGYPTQIELFSPDDVTPMRDKASGVVTYRVNRVVYAQNEIFHVRAFRMPGIDFGLSPIQQAALTINRDYAIQQFSLGYFQDAPHPSSVLTSDQAINAEAARTIKERLIAAVTGREPLVLGAGLKFTPLAVSPEESQFLQTQKYGAAEICRFFGVPPQKVAAADVGSSMTYATVESSSLDLLVWPIQWWLTNLEQAFATLLPGQNHVRFDTSVLLRTDLETRMKATAIAIASKQLTPDEARAMGDMPPLTDDQLALLALVPLAVTPPKQMLPLPAKVLPEPPEGEPA